MQQNWTDLQVITQLSSGSRWFDTTISYAFPTTVLGIYGNSGELDGFVPLDPLQQERATIALFTWDDLIKPDFVKASVSNTSNVEFGYTSTGINYAHAYLPTTGSVWFSNNHADLRPPVIGGYGFNTYVHEIGHALGLDHMGNYDGSENMGPSSWQDSSVFSIMSYYGPSNSSGGEDEVAWADWIGTDGVEYSPQTPMVNDVMAIQSIYGSSSTRPDDTTYGFDTNISGLGANLYNFANNTHPILCIYDSAGTDTLNLSGWSTISTVDLQGGPDHFTSCNGMTSNIQIARGVVIENAITGAGNDSIKGNATNNFLGGNQGNDTIEGGAGNDTIVGGDGSDSILLSGFKRDYLVDYQVATDSYLISDTRGIDGLDSIYGIESVRFMDGAFELPFLASSAVYRFFNAVNGVHFYTGSSIEAEIVKATLPAYTFEGVAFQKLNTEDSAANALNVYRFYNAEKGAHFYTANEQEVAHIQSALPQFSYEGVAFQAHSQETADSMPLYRFYNVQTGTHFYTANQVERDHVVLTLAGSMNYEGVAFYVDM